MSTVESIVEYPSKKLIVGDRSPQSSRESWARVTMGKHKTVMGKWGQQDKFRWKEGIEVRYSLEDPANSLIRWLMGH